MIAAHVGDEVWRINLEAVNAHAGIGVVVHKRKGRGDPGDAYVTMDLRTFCQLLAYDDTPT